MMNPEEFLKEHPSLSRVKLNVENKLVWIDDIHETQIDKQRVKEAMEEIKIMFCDRASISNRGSICKTTWDRVKKSYKGKKQPKRYICDSCKEIDRKIKELGIE